MRNRQQIELYLKVAYNEFEERFEKRTANLTVGPQDSDDFIYIISHDLKAPLRGIANLATWLTEDLDGQLEPENQHHLELMRERVAQMEIMIDGLLAYSRVGRRKVEEEVTDLNFLIFEIVDLFSPLSSFMITVPPNRPTVVTKRSLLAIVLFHLISNAIKHHNRDGGLIEIKAMAQGEYYEFAVTDDGPGIAPESHQKIFGIFQTLPSSSQSKNTGMGLAIVKKIVETESGKIVVESELGKGSTFRFTWPVRLEVSPEPS
ncbi:ATP-binding protein [Chroococcus sp. FPU101]|uniref:sensor histidine kinase n=1 Tax=Chroococcus sp. FPU101 TaxID=1974212 RepID=UPI001A8D7A1B|nr:ATP-binding protein [Chroococcus sp. FPU101]GFE72047.1 hypothetical protein CFPU101_46570 [Chroococcus sp. FPU101]